MKLETLNTDQCLGRANTLIFSCFLRNCSPKAQASTPALLMGPQRLDSITPQRLEQVSTSWALASGVTVALHLSSTMMPTPEGGRVWPRFAHLGQCCCPRPQEVQAHCSFAEGTGTLSVLASHVANTDRSGDQAVPLLHKGCTLPVTSSVVITQTLTILPGVYG